MSKLTAKRLEKIADMLKEDAVKYPTTVEFYENAVVIKDADGVVVQEMEWEHYEAIMAMNLGGVI